MKVSPFAVITDYQEKQRSYTDALGRLPPSQNFDFGRLEFSPKASRDHVRDDRVQLLSYLSFSGI